MIDLVSIWTSFHVYLTNLVYKSFHSSKLNRIYALIYLDSLSTFSFGLCLTLFLSTDFGFGDQKAGIVFGIWDALSTLCTLLTGILMDWIGVTKSLRIGFFLTLVARILIFSTTHTWILCIAIIILSVGSCLCSPVLTICIKQATVEEETRRFAFGLYYVIMNVAALCSGPLVDISSRILVQTTNKHDKAQNYPSYPWTLSPYRLVFLCTIISNLIAICIVSVESNTSHILVHTTDEEIELTPFDEASSSEPQSFSWITLLETIQSKAFLRFIALCIITINIQTMFQHFDATLPKYLIRVYGQNVSYGTIFSINPAIIIIFVPLISAWTSHNNPLILIHFGSYVSAVSVFFMAIWISIPSTILFMFIWSIGEAIWSPRLVDYLVSMSTEGKEGTFMALSSVPLFIAKLPVGWLSGYLLGRYCPDSHGCDGNRIWSIIAVMTTTSPILITVFWNYLSQPNECEVKNEEIQDACTRIEMERLESNS